MERNLKMFVLPGILAVMITVFTGCSGIGGLTAPVGDAADYTELEVKDATYDLAPGSGYHLIRYLPTTQYYTGSTGLYVNFTATEDAEIYYSDKLYADTIVDIDVRHVDGTNVDLIPIKENTSNSSTEKFSVEKGDSIRLSIKIYKYNTKKSKAAEFYIWAK